MIPIAIPAVLDLLHRATRGLTRTTCGECVFFHLVADAKIGECRRYAPRPGWGSAAPWPTTAPSNWCGEAVDRGAVAELVQKIREKSPGDDNPAESGEGLLDRLRNIF